MVELGLAASVIAVIQITTKVASLSYAYISSVKRAPGDIPRLVDELKSLTTVLTTLQICMQGSSSSGPTALGGLEGQLQGCISALMAFWGKGDFGLHLTH